MVHQTNEVLVKETEAVSVKQTVLEDDYRVSTAPSDPADEDS